MILVGKFLFGFTSGVINIAAPKMLDETVPTYMLKSFGLATNAYICLGITLAMIIGFGFPREGDTQAMKNDEFWRVVFGFPIIFCVFN
jgi:MFS family permease